MNHLNLSIQLISFDMLRNSYCDERIVNTCVSSNGDVLPIPNLSIVLESPTFSNDENYILMPCLSTRLSPLDSLSTIEDPNIIMACFESSEGTKYIPEESIIEQLLFPRELDAQFINDIADVYDLPEHIYLAIKNAVDTTNISKSWKKIVKIICNMSHNKDLCRIISLQSYKQLIQVKLSDSIRSLLSFIEFSNFVISQIMHEIDNPSEVDIITRNYCDKNDIDYQLIQYQQSMNKYFDRMLPLPLNFISNADTKKGLNSFFITNVNKYEKEPNREVILSSDRKQKTYMEQMIKSEKIRRIYFPVYYRTISLIYDFQEKFELEHPEINRELLNRNELSFKEKLVGLHSGSHNNTPAENDTFTALHRCQFCDLFSLIELKRGQNEPAYHCGRTQCKNKYGAWLKYLQNNGCHLRDRFD